MICQLYFDAEMVMADIGEMLDITESRVSQRLLIVKKEIEKVSPLSEKLSEYQDDPEYSKLCVDWITI
jgi:DNA-directed RNA polymerase specialized sigma subunit